MNRPSLVLADEHKLFLEGCFKLLESAYDLAAIVEDGRTLVRAVKEKQPDAVILSISLPLLNGFDAASQISKVLPQVKIVFLTTYSDKQHIAEAFRCGGSGYLLKHCTCSELMIALREVLKGRQYVSPLVTKEMVEMIRDPAEGKHRDLTPRQREVLQLVAEGCSIKEIATILNISVKAVEFHKARLAEALNIRSTAQLTRYAIGRGLVAL